MEYGEFSHLLEAVDMLAQFELLLVERARHLEHHVSEHQGGVVSEILASVSGTSGR